MEKLEWQLSMQEELISAGELEGGFTYPFVMVGALPPPPPPLRVCRDSSSLRQVLGV
jgi:hypothetical protein